MTIVELGVLGEFLGAIGVIATLAYLAVQAACGSIGAVIVKLTSAGCPEDIGALDTLTIEERGRFRLWQIAQQTHCDNMHFQYQQRFLDAQYYRDAFTERVQRLWPTWLQKSVR